MIPKRVTLRNFLSFGDPGAEIVFADDEPLWVVGGPNGVGKSAVFDAITFCLFGEHRGGGRDVEPLTRHGSTGFAVGVEFELYGTDYRVVRARTGNRPTQSVHRREGGEWRAVPNINNATDVTKWVQGALGLEFAAFASSVLLRQGKADEVVTAKPRQRLECLKAVIPSMSEYERLGERVRAATTKAKSDYRAAQQRRDTLPAVSAEDVQRAAVAAAEAEAARTAAEAAVAAAGERVQQAKRFAEINVERQQLADKKRAADAREADADAIRRDHVRLTDLAGVLPTLAKLIPLRDGLPAVEREHATSVQQLETATADHRTAHEQVEAQKLASARHRQQAADLSKDANRMQAEIARLEKDAADAERLTALDDQLAAFETDLDARCAEATAARLRADEAQQSAREASAAAKAELKSATAERAEFSVAEAGGRCQRCGQTVSPDHVERERARLDAVIRDLTARVEAADRRAREAASAAVQATKLAVEHEKRVKERDALATRRRTLAEVGVSADPTGLRRQIADTTAAVAAAQAAHATEREKQQAAEAELKAAETRLVESQTRGERLTAAVNRFVAKLSADRATLDALVGHLPAGWATATAAELSTWQAEEKALTAASVAARFRELEHDFAQRQVWADRSAALDADLASLPADARVPVADADRGLTDARSQFKQVDTAHQAARNARDVAERQAKELAAATAAVAAAEQTASRHGTLDDLLGNAGLQRELVRRAEAEIVKYAAETVSKLSDGELTLSLDGAADDQKALKLSVRVGDDPTPTPVEYLSGSQKFRVAVAVALGIGRFATGGSRPLECVIIDEGFGSLDRDGLRAAADELTRLRTCLRRIILVSHQEEFADRFPAVIKLERGEAGTTATAVRR